jgi:hypothetical protein
MRYSKLIAFLLVINSFGCQKKNEKLFWIDENSNGRSDFLFLTESTNLKTITGDSLKLFLTEKELQNFDSTSTKLKSFGQIYKTAKFKVIVLLFDRTINERFYTFKIRTYDHSWRIVDNFELGIWDELGKKFCFGSINKDLVIERKCEKKDTSDIMQITDEGKIIMTSYHKP